MPDAPGKNSLFDPTIIERLACPVCLGGLAVHGQLLRCAQCGRGYPVVDGIPVLIAGRAENPPC